MEIAKVANQMEQQAEGFKAIVCLLNIAWFEILPSEDGGYEVTVAFEDIDCMTIERYFKMYIESKGDAQYRVVILGAWSVDLKLMLKFLTDDKDNEKYITIVIRGASHQRQRPETQELSRFKQGSLAFSLEKRNITDPGESNFIGEKWKELFGDGNKYGRLPSFNEVGDGLTEEAVSDLELKWANPRDKQKKIKA